MQTDPGGDDSLGTGAHGSNHVRGWVITYYTQEIKGVHAQTVGAR